MRKTYILLVSAIILAVIAIGAFTLIVQKPQEVAYPLTVKDALGREVVIQEKPQRIISMAPSITEILFALDLSDEIVGVDDYSNYPPQLFELIEAGKIERIGGFSTPNIEKIVALQPDIVFATGGVQAKFVYQLEELGLTTIALYGENISAVYRSIELAGIVTGKVEEAKTLIKELKEKIENISQLTKQADYKPKVLYIVWLDPLMSVGKRSFINDLIEAAGGENIFADLEKGYPVVSPEEIVVRDPDIIIVSGHAALVDYNKLISTLKEFPGLSEVKAMKEGEVYLLRGESNDIVVRAGPRIAVAVELFATIFYPEIMGKKLPNVIEKFLPESVE